MLKVLEYFQNCNRTVPSLILLELESLHEEDSNQKTFKIGAFSCKNWTKKLAYGDGQKIGDINEMNINEEKNLDKYDPMKRLG